MGKITLQRKKIALLLYLLPSGLLHATAVEEPPQVSVYQMSRFNPATEEWSALETIQISDQVGAGGSKRVLQLKNEAGEVMDKVLVMRASDQEYFGAKPEPFTISCLLRKVIISDQLTEAGFLTPNHQLVAIFPPKELKEPKKEKPLFYTYISDSFYALAQEEKYVVESKGGVETWDSTKSLFLQLSPDDIKARNDVETWLPLFRPLAEDLVRAKTNHCIQSLSNMDGIHAIILEHVDDQKKVLGHQIRLYLFDYGEDSILGLPKLDDTPLQEDMKNLYVRWKSRVGFHANPPTKKKSQQKLNNVVLQIFSFECSYLSRPSQQKDEQDEQKDGGRFKEPESPMTLTIDPIIDQINLEYPNLTYGLFAPIAVQEGTSLASVRDTIAQYRSTFRPITGLTTPYKQHYSQLLERIILDLCQRSVPKPMRQEGAGQVKRLIIYFISGAPYYFESTMSEIMRLSIDIELDPLLFDVLCVTYKDFSSLLKDPLHIFKKRVESILNSFAYLIYTQYKEEEREDRIASFIEQVCWPTVDEAILGIDTEQVVEDWLNSTKSIHSGVVYEPVVYPDRKELSIAYYTIKARKYQDKAADYESKLDAEKQITEGLRRELNESGRPLEVENTQLKANEQELTEKQTKLENKLAQLQMVATALCIALLGISIYLFLYRTTANDAEEEAENEKLEDSNIQDETEALPNN